MYFFIIIHTTISPEPWSDTPCNGYNTLILCVKLFLLLLFRIFRNLFVDLKMVF